MELRHLRYFVAVASHLSYRRAAEHLRVAQPALSKQIKDLEHDVGARLFDRNTARVALTDAGQVFLAEAQAILERVDQAVKASREAESGRRGALTIGHVGTLTSSFIPAALAAFRGRYPEVDVILRDLNLSEQRGALNAGEIHVGFTVDGRGDLPKHFESFAVLESTVALALSREHRLAALRRVPAEKLLKETILCVGEGANRSLHAERVQQILAKRGVKIRPPRLVNSFESLIAMVAGEHGVTLLSSDSQPRNPEGIVFRPLKEEGDDLHFVLLAMWRRDNPSRLAQNFIEVLRAVRARRK